jgi:FRG domain
VSSGADLKNTVGWHRVDIPEGGGSVTFRLASWANFFDFLETEVFRASGRSKQDYVWRGQRRKDWSLSSSLDRLFQKLNLAGEGPSLLEDRSQRHLDAFKYATRGRRGPNRDTLLLDNDWDNDWWALGQHFGLATPLLDWTRSPFAAAYFAFEELAADPTDHRVVYGLDRSAVQQKNQELTESVSIERGRPPTLEFVESMTDENQRLVSQGGLFTRAPIFKPVEQWVAQAFETSGEPILLRIEIPDADRLVSLRALNRMNINHLSLFPDLTGASRATNLKLECDL